MGASLHPTYAQIAQVTHGKHSERDHTNQPGILPGRINNTNRHKSQMSGCGIQLDSLPRRRVLDPPDRQGRGILPTRPPIRCCGLRLGNQAEPPNRTQEATRSSWVETGYNGTPHHEMANMLLRQLPDTRERKKKGRTLAQKTERVSEDADGWRGGRKNIGGLQKPPEEMRGADGTAPKRNDGKRATPIIAWTNGTKPPRRPRRSRSNSSRITRGTRLIRKGEGQAIQPEIGDSEEGKRNDGVGKLALWDQR